MRGEKDGSKKVTSIVEQGIGFSKSLESYKMKINLAQSSTCPQCGADDHTTSHLFSCTCFPTPLVVKDLWLKPVKVALFLSQLPIISHLPSLNRLPPRQPPLVRPPPEPPPYLPHRNERRWQQTATTTTTNVRTDGLTDGPTDRQSLLWSCILQLKCQFKQKCV